MIVEIQVDTHAEAMALQVLFGERACTRDECVPSQSTRTLGQHLVEMRGRRGLTQRDLAVMSGITERTISNIETGSMTPRAFTLGKIASALGVPIGYIASEPLGGDAA